ncbi:LytR family regulatory protein [Streptococcus porcinus]|uniref:glycopolymer--peptidoglycan transferase LytR n=1 Tax=Streptococcus porcinus TaxID=1340 RepID=UPI0010CAC916|nr:LCP family protein [Streptococcus porcinus]VTS42842.1 LytR family regulatory protein [Streptococcus porcinus]
MKIGKKIFLMILTIICMTLIAIGVYATSAYNFSTGELAKTFKDFNTSDKKTDVIKQTKPFSILLMGVDTGSSERKSKWSGNSDSMILVTINPETKKTTMTSLERDILMKLSGPNSNDMNGAEAKLNAAYASGGAQMAIMTVQDLLNIKIDKYIQINMQGLIDLVDAVGGITVTNEFDFPISISENEPEYQAKVQPGTHKVNGEQALVYARMRYDDPEGDYGRQKRQRLVIQKVIKKILALNSISSYRKILHAVSNNMQTNIEISSQTIPALLGYADALKEINSYQLKGEDATLADGGSYQIVKEDHLLGIQNRIRRQLGLSEITELKTSAVTYEELYGLEGSSKAKTEASSGITTQSDGQYSGQVNNNSSYYSTPNNFNTGVPSESIPSTVPGSTNSSVTGGATNSGSLSTNTGATTEPVSPVSPAPNGGTNLTPTQ